MHAPALFSSAVLLLSAPVVDVSVGVGGDSNPYEMPVDPDAAGARSGARAGAFVPVEARARWRSSPGAGVRFAADGWYEGSFFGYVSPDPAATESVRPADLNRARGGASLPVLWAPVGRGRPVRVVFSLEPFVGANRETYTSHRTGRPMRIDVDPDPDAETRVSLARRYDTNEAGVRSESELKLGDDFELALNGSIAEVDYLEDFLGVEAVDSWDHREYLAGVDARATPGAWQVGAGYAWRFQDFRERFPRDLSGEKVLPSDGDYEPQEFVSHVVAVRAGFVGDRGRAVLRGRGVNRVDLHAGYLDYTEARVSADVRIRFGRDSELRVEPSYSLRRYDDLRVGYDPSEPVSTRRRASVEAALEWPAFTRRTRIFVSAQAVSQLSTNPLFTYSAVRGTTGVRVQIR